ncbi:DUF4232 domain-containing protein [Saccharopolyspora rosea]|uniref:DUF4232 domain-containing protein n=1 Tax=Saccharopolyspora rosea TaxID=524884 RepID=A0ABW3FM46_9PSEU|nr:DUF4232 domain-containing protein [Saccharopolyspora rosea]
MPKPIRILGAVAGLCTAAALSAACSQPATDAQSATAGSDHSGAANAATSGGDEEGAGKASACNGGEFKVDFNVQPQQPGGFLVAVTNKSDQPCTVNGWMKVKGTDMKGDSVDLPVHDVPVPGAPTDVTIKPGETAFAGMKVETGSKADPNTKVVSGLEAQLPGIPGEPNSTIVPDDGKTWQEQPDPTIPVKSVELGTLQPTPQGALLP